MGIKGGSRPGAGRKKGAPNKRTVALIKAVEESGETPLQFLLRVMREPIPEDADFVLRAAMMAQRFEAAKAAAPYVHARLATVDNKHSGKVTLEQLLAP